MPLTSVQQNLIDQSAVLAGGVGTASGLTSCLVIGRVAVEVTPSANLSNGCLLTLEVSIDGTNWTGIAAVRTGLDANEAYLFEFDVDGWQHVRIHYGSTSANVAIRADLSGLIQ